jgi:hypothetical protein
MDRFWIFVVGLLMGGGVMATAVSAGWTSDCDNLRKHYNGRTVYECYRAQGEPTPP